MPDLRDHLPVILEAAEYTLDRLLGADRGLAPNPTIPQLRDAIVAVQAAMERPTTLRAEAMRERMDRDEREKLIAHCASLPSPEPDWTALGRAAVEGYMSWSQGSAYKDSSVSSMRAYVGAAIKRAWEEMQ